MKKQFGHNQHGEPATLYLLENDRFRIAVTDYGATLVSFIDKNRDLELVAGFDDVEHYVQHTAHFGSTIGRVANRMRRRIRSNDALWHDEPFLLQLERERVDRRAPGAAVRRRLRAQR
ncbi:hypothetical protein [uncultured Dubosiella sp.]|uniref:aldose epimerase family protein n=1 Tax=uncultured Dubosiella sp. TaxID=1937011 RepID=UPI0033BA4393